MPSPDQKCTINPDSLVQRDECEWRPAFFRLSEESDRTQFQRLLRAGPRQPRVFDSILTQVHDLIKTRLPGRKLTGEELDALTREHFGNRPVDEYGVWAYYGWSGRLVHILNEAEFVELRTNRNLYKITTDEQQELASKRVGVVGLSVGQAIALTVVLERSAGELRLADFDRIDLSNLNRLRAGVHCIDVPKVLVTAREISEIDPYLRVEVFPEGINEANIGAFLTTGGKLHAVVEECDSLDVKILIRHRARQLGIPVVMATSDNGMLDVERFDKEPNRPILHGLADDLQPVALRGLSTEQKVPYVAKILDLSNASERLRASLLEVEQTISTWPQLGSSVTSGGGDAADALRRILIGESMPSGRYLIGRIQNEGAKFPNPSVRSEETTTQICEDILLRDLVGQAVLAPSGGNAQPWKWVAGEDRIDLFLDPHRSSELDFQWSGSYTALGCATENLIMAAHHAQREIRLETFPAGPQALHVARFRLLAAGDSEAEPHWRDDLYDQIALRRTNRKRGTRQAIPFGIIEDLTSAARSIPSIDIRWLTGENDLALIGELVGITDRLRLLSPTFHRELFGELRWTKEAAVADGAGIDVETLELSPSDRTGLEILLDPKVLELVRAWGGGRKLEEPAHRLIAGSSAVGLIFAPQAGALDFFNGGRAFQRLWLMATRLGICIQPITVLPYLLARLKRGRGEGLDEQMAHELCALLPRWEQLFDNRSGPAEVMLFRLGTGSDTEKRSLRRPLDQVLSARAIASP